MEQLPPSTDRHDWHVRMQNRINFYGPVIVVFVPVVCIGFFVFGVYVFSHWTLFVGQTASIFNWLLLFGALCGYALLAWLWACAFDKVGKTFVNIYRSVSEARGQRVRNMLLHAAPNYVVHADRKGNVIVTPVIHEKVINTHKFVDAPPLPSPAEAAAAPGQLPPLVRYGDILDEIPDGHSLIGVGVDGVVTDESSHVRALVWIVGGSGVGKTNSTTIRVEEDYHNGHVLLVVDPHQTKSDSLSNAIAPYADRFLLPIAHKQTETRQVLQRFIDEAANRIEGARWSDRITLVVDEVESLTMNCDTDDERELAEMVKRAARLCGQELRDYGMSGIFISHGASRLKWLRRDATLVLVHQIREWQERILACDNERAIAHDMTSWPKGRTYISGLAFEDAGVYQQPLVARKRRVSTLPFSGPTLTDSREAEEPRTDVLREQEQPDELSQAYDAWTSGANSINKLRDAMGITQYRAQQVVRQLKEMNLID